MKKMYKYIMTVAIVLMGLLQFTSCNDANDWAVDPSLVKQRPPSSFKMDIDDIKIPSWKGTIGTVAGAKSYEVQMSQSPLSSNGNLPVEGEIHTMKVDYTGDEGDLVIDREHSDFPRLQWGNTYYFRIRAIGEDGTVSNWFTNGKLYNGGVTDEALEKKLIEHTYEKSSDYNSYAMITVHPLLWSESADISENSITVRWHEITSGNITYLRNGEDGELIDISSTPSEESHPDFEKVKAYNYKFDGLESGTEYTFYLLDDNKNVLATTTSSTETAPDMNLALKIDDWGTIANGTDVTVRDATGRFIVDIAGEGAKIKTETDKTDLYFNPKGILECPMANGMRLTTGGKAGSMTLTLPAATGRLYAYTHVGSSGAGRKMLVKRLSDGNNVEFLPPNSKVSGKNEAGESKTGYVYQKIYITDEDIDKENNKVTVTITWDASIYICGFCFVPWEAITE